MIFFFDKTSSLSTSIKLIGLILLIILVGSNMQWNGIEEADTPSYLDIAKYGLQSSYIHFRPFVYPLLIKISILLSDNYVVLVVLQAIAYIISYSLVSWGINPKLIKGNVASIIVDIVTILAFCAPQSIAAVSVILPELLPLLPFTVIIFLLANPIRHQSIGIILCGILLILLKPVWIILFPVFILLSLLFHFQKKELEKKRMFRIFAGVLLLYLGNQLAITSLQHKPTTAASTMDVNLNLAMIRYGLIDGAEGTTLYHFLSEEQLYSSIINRKWDNTASESSSFTAIKNHIPWQKREDPTYWKNIILHNDMAPRFVMFQLSRLPKFFSASASNENVDFTSISFLNYCYQGFYIRIHKIFIPLLYLLVLIVCIVPKLSINSDSALSFTGYSILLFAFVTTFFTYQDSSFLRLRSGIEPMLLMCPVYFFNHIQTAFTSKRLQQPF